MTNKDSINKILSRLESVRNEIESIRRDLKFILEKEGNQKLICFPELFKHR